MHREGEEPNQDTAQDTTVRQQMADALRTDRDRIQLYLDIVNVMIVALDTAQRITLINRKGAEILGYPQDEIIGMNWHETFVPARLRAQVIITFQHLMTGEIAPVEYFENPVVTRSGEERVIAWHNSVLRDEAGNIIGTLSSGDDITERKRVEHSLRLERALLASAIELLPFPIIFFAPSRAVIRQNKASRELQSAQGDQFWWTLRLFDPQTHTEVPLEAWPVMCALQGEVVPATELIAVLPDGQEMPILLYSAPVFTGEDFIAAVVALQNITTLKEADRAKNQFLKIISHEMRTPLTAIIGWAQLAESDPTLSGEALQAILHSARLQHAALERLILLSRILTGKLTLQRVPTDLWVLVDQVATASQTRAQERQITLLCNPPTEPLPVQVDWKLMQQAVQEMLDNALTYTSAGGQVTVSVTRMENHAVVAVHDTGQGITLDQLPKLWKPFQQVLRQESLGGLGIGLVLLRGIVEAHGGQVFIVSPGLEQGSTFSISIALVLPLPTPQGDGS